MSGERITLISSDARSTSKNAMQRYAFGNGRQEKLRTKQGSNNKRIALHLDVLRSRIVALPRLDCKSDAAYNSGHLMESRRLDVLMGAFGKAGECAWRESAFAPCRFQRVARLDSRRFGSRACDGDDKSPE